MDEGGSVYFSQSPWMGFPLFYWAPLGRRNLSAQLSGRYEVKVDPKFRIVLPVGFRTHIDNSPMIITNSQYQGKRCLDIYSLNEWKKLEARIAKHSQLKVEVQNFQRFYLSGGHRLELDSQGRILIPPSLRSYAGIESMVVVVGFSNKLEVWAQSTWNALFDNLVGGFENTLAALSSLEDKGEP